MEMIKLKCPECGGPLELKGSGYAECPFCDSKFFLDEDEQPIHVEQSPSYPGTQPYIPPKTAEKKSHAGAFLIIALTICAFVFAGVVATSMGTSSIDDIVSNYEYRTSVESDAMIDFVETAFQKSIDEITAEDYERVTSMVFTTGENTALVEEDDYLNSVINLSYVLDGTDTYTYQFVDDFLSDEEIPFEDFQPFTNLEMLNFNECIELSGWAWGEGDLKNLTKLTGFGNPEYGDLDVVIEKLFDTEQITYLQTYFYFEEDEDPIGTLVNAFPNLENLSLSGYTASGEMSDLGSIEALGTLKNLKTLNIFAYSDMNYLSSLDSLESLTISCKAGETYQLDSLSALTNLTALTIYDEETIKNADFLDSMTGLKELRLYDTALKSADFLNGRDTITTLAITGEELQDYSFLQSMTGLQELYISQHWGEEENVPDLSVLPDLHTVHIGVTELAALNGSSSVTDLSVEMMSVFEQESATESIASLPNLEHLTLHGTDRLYEYQNLESCENLKTLTTDGIYLSVDDFAELLNLPYLEELVVKGENPLTIYPENVKENDHLRVLQVSGLDDISIDGDYTVDSELAEFAYILDGFTALEELSVPNGGLEDIEFVRNMPNLRILNINGNYVSDLTPLEACENLEILYCRDNPLNTADVPEGVRVISN